MTVLTNVSVDLINDTPYLPIMPLVLVALLTTGRTWWASYDSAN